MFYVVESTNRHLLTLLTYLLFDDGWYVWSVVGCPDIQTNADVDVQYSTDRSVAAVTCRRRPIDGGDRTTAASWRLACSDRGWHGYIGNCSAGSALLGELRVKLL